jgi:multidrug efflux pump subunit AcrA (membrane-fusion protein)
MHRRSDFCEERQKVVSGSVNHGDGLRNRAERDVDLSVSSPGVVQQLLQARATLAQSEASLQQARAALEQAQANAELARLTRQPRANMSKCDEYAPVVNKIAQAAIAGLLILMLAACNVRAKRAPGR